MTEKIVHITPDPHCKYCHGEGMIYDTVDYGSTTAQLPSYCDCVINQLSEDDADSCEIVIEVEPDGE